MDVARTLISLGREHRLIDVVFLSPPWGGPSYIDGSPKKSTGASEDLEADSSPDYSLESIKPIPGPELFHLSRQITRNIAFLVPRTTNLNEISDLLPKGAENDVTEKVEVEEEYMGNKLKALTCYFGGLVSGQEALFES